MLHLTEPTDKLEILLGASPASQLPWYLASIDGGDVGPTAIKRANGVTNGTSPVTMLTGPTSPVERVVRYILLRNNNGAIVTVTLRITAAGVVNDLPAYSLAPGDVMEYIEKYGFKFTDATGAIKGVFNPTVAATTIIVQEADAVPTLTGIDTLSFDQATGLSVTAGGAGEAIVAFTAPPAGDDTALAAMFFLGN